MSIRVKRLDCFVEMISAQREIVLVQIIDDIRVQRAYYSRQFRAAITVCLLGNFACFFSVSPAGFLLLLFFKFDCF